MQKSGKKVRGRVIRGKNLVTEQISGQVNHINLLQAELNLITERQRAPLGEMSESYAQRLGERRIELTRKLQKERPQGRVLRATQAKGKPPDVYLTRLVSEIGRLFGSCSQIAVPIMAEGSSDTPGVPGTSGEIDTISLWHGQVDFGGRPLDTGQQNPDTEKFWSHHWNWTVVFPPAPSDGTISFDFAVDCGIHIVQAPAHLGYVGTPVTLMTTSDAESEPLSNLTLVGWPTNISLPQTSFDSDTTLPVSGTIAAKAGRSAAVALFCGAIVGMASGSCTFGVAPDSYFYTRLSSGRQPWPIDYGMIQYCFNPTWWIEAVRARYLETLRAA
ncbi:MAG: hypothetical protein OK455_08930 [Thaumarchaeota archaeon]|nr:hypothetical protein [Nitrososphaerota archaeon]